MLTSLGNVLLSITETIWGTQLTCMAAVVSPVVEVSAASVAAFTTSIPMFFETWWTAAAPLVATAAFHSRWCHRTHPIHPIPRPILSSFVSRWPNSKQELHVFDRSWSCTSISHTLLCWILGFHFFAHCPPYHDFFVSAETPYDSRSDRFDIVFFLRSNIPFSHCDPFG